MNLVMIAVSSLDGRITRPNESGAGFASVADQQWFHHALTQFDCSILGRRTYDTIREQIRPATGTARLRLVVTRTPERYAAETVPGVVEFASGSPAEIVSGLRMRRFQRCAVLGGGEIYRQFLAAGLVDAVWLTLEPVFLGGGTPLVDGVLADRRLSLVEVRHLSTDTLLLNYRRGDSAGVPLPHS